MQKQNSALHSPQVIRKAVSGVSRQFFFLICLFSLGLLLTNFLCICQRNCGAVNWLIWVPEPYIIIMSSQSLVSFSMGGGLTKLNTILFISFWTSCNLKQLFSYLAFVSCFDFFQLVCVWWPICYSCIHFGFQVLPVIFCSTFGNR